MTTARSRTRLDALRVRKLCCVSVLALLSATGYALLHR